MELQPRLFQREDVMPLSVIVMPLPTGVGSKARVGTPWNATAEADDADSAYRALTDGLRTACRAGSSSDGWCTHIRPAV